MNILDKFINKVGMDKLVHFVVVILIVLSIAVIDVNYFNRPAIVAAAIGAFAGAAVGVLKEILDFFLGKSFDLQDLKFDLYGCIAGFVWALILNLL